MAECQAGLRPYRSVLCHFGTDAELLPGGQWVLTSPADPASDLPSLFLANLPSRMARKSGCE